MRYLIRAKISLLKSFMGTIQCLSETCLLDGFQQVINCVYLEGAYGVLVISSNECDQRRRVLSQQTHYAETIHFWHLQIKKCEIRLLPFDDFYCFAAIAGFTHNFDIFKASQHGSQKRTRRPLIIRNYDS